MITQAMVEALLYRRSKSTHEVVLMSDRSQFIPSYFFMVHAGSHRLAIVKEKLQERLRTEIGITLDLQRYPHIDDSARAT